MTFEFFKITSEVEETESTELINNCLPVCNPSICVPGTGECGPTHKP